MPPTRSRRPLFDRGYPYSRFSRDFRRAAGRLVRRSGRFFGPIGAALTAKDAFGLAGRVYRNARNKRKWSKYKEAPNKKPRSAGPPGPAGSVPKTPSSRVPAKYAVATRMTKFKKEKVMKVKNPKSAIAHYKEFGLFHSDKCMYVNHEHWGHVDRFWKGIAYGLTKLLLAKANIYNAKSLEDPCIGPRTNQADIAKQYDDKTNATTLILGFYSEGSDGSFQKVTQNIVVEDQSPSPDVYRTFDAIATDVANTLSAQYETTGSKRWLQDAAIVAPLHYALTNAQPIFIQNLDDAEIHLYVNSLIKFQNVTSSDAGSLDKHSVDANPIIGRMFTAKYHKPMIDGDLLQSGQKTLDTFFGDVDPSPGIVMLGSTTTPNNDDIGRIVHIPQARELYGNQTVSTASIHMKPGDQKFHKTSYKLVKTFRDLASYDWEGGPPCKVSPHTMFGFTLQHRHGEDTIHMGWNRDVDVGCYIRYKRSLYPLKTNYTLDVGDVTTVGTINPTDHQ